MNNNVKSTNLRFNLDKPEQRKAWDYLQTMNKQEFKSYSHIIAIAINQYFDRYYKMQDDPYLETREREEQFVSQILENLQIALGKSLPLFLAGCVANMVATDPTVTQPAPSSNLPQSTPEDPTDSDVDWDFLGE